MKDGVYLKSRFSNYTIMKPELMSNDPDDWSHFIKLKAAMIEVLNNNKNTTSFQSGHWYRAQCISVPNGGDNNYVGMYVHVFVPHNDDSTPIGSNYLVAAPCPPFCGGDNAA